jgi:hypothetical protein
VKPPDHPSNSTDGEEGLYGKFHVARVDGRDEPGGDKAGARYFVLDYVNDPLARWPLLHYANAAWAAGYEELARDLWGQLRDLGMEFKTPPEERAKTEATVAWVKNRLTELYGPDPDKWPKITPEGR